MITIKIGRLRNKFFTREQKAKLEAGIDIYQKLVVHEHFKDLALQYHWSNNTGRTFRRFLMSNGLSNSQVLQKLENCEQVFEDLGMKNCFGLLPCDNRKDISSFKMLANPIIWMPTSCLNHNWFTPVHVASLILHEVMTYLGFTTKINPGSEGDQIHTVPFALGKLLMVSAHKWKNQISDIDESLAIINERGYNYFPTSHVFDTEFNQQDSVGYQDKIEDLLNNVNREAEDLSNLENKMSNSEVKRLACLEKIKEQLINIQNEIIESSLDGSEVLNANSYQKPARQQ